MLKDVGTKRLLVVDTNVLTHDPTALFRFKEHNIFLPMVVLEELDQSNKGGSERARNARQVSRLLDQIILGKTHDEIMHGLPLPVMLTGSCIPCGKLFFQTRVLPAALPKSLPGQGSGNTILGTALALQIEHPDTRVTLVSKDINLRIKAAVVGIHAEDYYSDQVLDDVSLLFSGTYELPADFRDSTLEGLTSWQGKGNSGYILKGPMVAHWYPNQCQIRPLTNFSNEHSQIIE